MVQTRQATAPLTHVLTTILQEDENSALTKALAQNRYDTMNNVISIMSTDLDHITYIDSDTVTPIMQAQHGKLIAL